MFVLWRDVFYFLFGAVVGVVISTAMDWNYVSRAMRKVAECQAELVDPDHCAPYCNAAWRDYYGC